MAIANTFDAEIPEEEHDDVAAEQSYRRLLAKLSQQSVVKHFDAYADIPWDDPAFAIVPTDPRFELAADHPLASTVWYQSQPQALRARLGLHMVATFMRLGWEFESVLKRGLLDFARTLPEGAPEFRYVYHEIIEEAQHSLMFREAVARTGLETRTPGILRRTQQRVTSFGRRFPELFLMFVLSGEDPIDWYQRRELQSGRQHHPLLERISRIHTTEEARHMAFARHYLRRTVPKLNTLKRLHLRLHTPIILKIASMLMLRPSQFLVRTYGIPKEALAQAYGPGSIGECWALAALRKPRELCWELGILDDRWSWYWRRLGIWAPRGA